MAPGRNVPESRASREAANNTHGRNHIMNNVYIEGNRNGYAPDQCGYTMTVRDFISCLEQFDGDARVYLRNERGYTYGSIRECDVSEAESGGEEEP
jgi:hypothetical protein